MTLLMLQEPVINYWYENHYTNRFLIFMNHGAINEITDHTRLSIQGSRPQLSSFFMCHKLFFSYITHHA